MVTGLDDAINKATGGASGTPETLWFAKGLRVGGAAAAATITGTQTSLWQYDGCPAAGAAPTTVAIPTRATTGALGQADATGGRTKRLRGIAVSNNAATGVLVMYDRLLHIGNLDGTSTGAQTVGGSITRNTGGVGNEIWIEIFTQIGATNTVGTVSYTNQAGASKTGTVIGGVGGTNFREAQRFIPVQLAQGDTGVQGVTSITLTASTTTAGNFGVVIARQVAMVHLPLAGTGGMVDYVTGIPVLPSIDTGACLSWYIISGTTSNPELFGSVCMFEDS